MIPPATWSPSLDEYHADPAIGASMLAEFRSNRRLFYAHYVAETLAPDPPTASMRTGTLVHAMIEDSATGGGSVRVVEAPDRRAKAYRDAIKAEPGVAIFPTGEVAAARAIADAILRPKTAAARAARGVLVDHQGASEYSVKWMEQQRPHFACKVRYDRLAVLDVGIVHADIKTSQDPAPEAFAGSVRKYGYIHALALRELAARFIGIELAAHFLVAVRSSPPHEVAVFQPQADALAAAHDFIRLELMELEELLAADSESAWFHAWENQVTPLNREEVS